MKRIFTTAFVFLTFYINAQTANCTEVIKENDYLKKVINLNKAQVENTFDKTNFKIISIEGNNKQQTIKISILLNNEDVNKYVSFNSFTGLDLEGNEYFKENYVDIKGLYDRGCTLNTGVPKKIEPVLIKVPTLTKYLKLFKFNYYSDILKKDVSIEFSDLKINWK